MKIYLIRHAESEGNVGSSIQHSEEPLTLEGISQAELISERLLRVGCDVILSSPERRAICTAEIISKKINKKIEANALLVEYVRPSFFNGLEKKDSEVIKAKKKMKRYFHDPNFRLSDEETFEDLKRRGIAFLEHIAARNESEIIVVTHSVFLRMIASLIIIGYELSSYEFWKFFNALSHKNTGITIARYNGPMVPGDFADIPSWELITWNDHAHLI